MISIIIIIVVVVVVVIVVVGSLHVHVSVYQHRTYILSVQNHCYGTKKEAHSQTNA